MITFVTWKWRGADGRRVFESAHVNVLRAMIARHCSAPHRLVCLTDEPEGLDPRIDAQPMPVTQLEHLLSPQRPRARKKPKPPSRHRPARSRQRQRIQIVARRGEARPVIDAAHHFPACYRRLWLFSDEARALGARLFLIDVDCVITGDLTPLTQHKGADFVGWTDPRFGWNKIAGGAWLLQAGSRTDVWADFDAERSPAMCAALGLQGSDQAWLSHKLWPPGAAWTDQDGLHKLNWLRPGAPLRTGARIVFTSGHSPPWAPQVKDRYTWIRQHWRL